MFAPLDDLTDHLRRFISSNTKLLLVTEVNDASNGLVVKVVDVLDEELGDMFWVVIDDFTTPWDFVERVARRVHERRELACKALAKEGDAEWPPLPGEAFDRARAPAERMRSLMLYARSLSPNLDNMRLVWGLFPTRIADPGAYRSFILTVLAHEFPSPWCHHMRVLVRDDTARPVLRDVANVVRGAVWYAPELEPGDLERAVEKQAADPTAPLEVRMQALVSLAAIDHAHKRFADAIDKYQLAGRYYRAFGRLALYSLTLNGIGEVMARAERPDDARRYFESALGPVVQRLAQKEDPAHADAIPVLLNVTLNLGNLHLSQQRWADAGNYYEGAKGIADVLANAQIKMLCLENVGICHYMLGQHAQAIRAWEEGTTLARGMDAVEPLRTLLARQRDAYHHLHMFDRRDAAIRELQQLEARPTEEGS